MYSICRRWCGPVVAVEICKYRAGCAAGRGVREDRQGWSNETLNFLLALRRAASLTDCLPVCAVCADTLVIVLAVCVSAGCLVVVWSIQQGCCYSCATAMVICVVMFWVWLVKIALLNVAVRPCRFNWQVLLLHALIAG